MAVRATEFGLASEDTFTPELQGCDPSYDVLEVCVPRHFCAPVLQAGDPFP
eukprot:m.206587 g.206587  ORF g.206587 m.206587 type:complete len:51 (+) comp15429_c0_seq3:116-268(+)